MPADSRHSSVPLAGVGARRGWAARVALHHAVSEKLAGLDDFQVGALLEDSGAAIVGIGGTTAAVSVMRVKLATESHVVCSRCSRRFAWAGAVPGGLRSADGPPGRSRLSQNMAQSRRAARRR